MALSLKQKIFVACLVFSGLLGLYWSDPATLVSAKHAGDSTNNHPESAGAPGQLRGESFLREFTAKLPLSFEQNVGQLDNRAKFSARGAGYNLFLTSTGALLELRKNNSRTNRKTSRASRPNRQTETETLPALLDLKLQGANANAIAKGVGELPGHRN